MENLISDPYESSIKITGHIIRDSGPKKIIGKSFCWHYFFIGTIMKRICFAVSIGLFIVWVWILSVTHAGLSAHTLIFLSVLLWLQGIILTAPKKITGEAE